MFAVVESNRRLRRLDEPRYSASNRVAHLALPWNVVSGSTPRSGIPRTTLHRNVGRVLDVDVGRFGRIPEHPEPRTRDDLATGLFLEPVRTAVVVGVTVGDHDRMHPLEWNSGQTQAMGDGFVVGGGGETRIDHGDATVVLEDVHVDVSEPGHVDGQLGTQDSGCDLVDLLGGRQLLLLGWSWSRRLGVGVGLGHEDEGTGEPSPATNTRSR